MVIQCSSCDTRFKLADDKLKPGGVKVRCSKCKEVFTVMPPEEETTATPMVDDSPDESSANDWSDLNSEDSSAEEKGPAEDGGIDWSDIGGSGDENATDDLSFDSGQESSEGSEISFDEGFDSGGISFDDESAGTDNISFDDDSGSVSEDDFGFDEPVGEGAQDEFSFDDESDGSLGVSDDAPDFDWDGTAESSEPDDFDFGDSESSSEGDLDFSSVALEEQEEPAAPVSPQSVPAPDTPPVAAERSKPLSAKGPQKSKGKQRGRKQKKVKKKSSLRGLLMFVLLLLILAGAHAGVLYWKGFWAGDPAELINLDHKTVHLQVYKDLYSELTGGKVVKEPEGQISVLGMNGQFLENNSAGTIFVIRGNVKNEYREPRSAIAVRGILFNQAGRPVMRKKVYCGNKLNDEELRSMSLDKINERLGNQFGDSLSNLDIAAGSELPYTIVFANLPDNLAEFNVEVAESTPGSK